MAEIVEFPDRALADFDDLKASISDELLAVGFGSELIDWITSEWDRRFSGWFPADWKGQFDLPNTMTVEDAEAVRATIKSRDQLIVNLHWQILIDLMELSAFHFNVAPPQATAAKARVFKLIIGDKDGAPDAPPPAPAGNA